MEQGQKPAKEIAKKEWGRYDGPWEHSNVDELPNDEVFPRLKHYVSIKESSRESLFTKKLMKDLGPMEQLSIIAVIDSCVTSIFEQRTSLDQIEEAQYDPDLNSPSNRERLKIFNKLTNVCPQASAVCPPDMKQQMHPDEPLLFLLERLTERDGRFEASYILKTIRMLARLPGSKRKSPVDPLMGDASLSPSSASSTPNPSPPNSSNPLEGLPRFALIQIIRGLRREVSDLREQIQSDKKEKEVPLYNIYPFYSTIHSPPMIQPPAAIPSPPVVQHPSIATPSSSSTTPRISICTPSWTQSQSIERCWLIRGRSESTALLGPAEKVQKIQTET
ncbi:hypothetical protein PROFUN_02011 [Planoprotostelium fungivorum]|uniref:Uncharacterized protein n=1 Tax=Planoprotostelium fungivorum TaxID=1890364 RepID=A0A2P6NB50_9EUKA|nr:hypothetical protein PROFUN_02011 [Planoprotostelium fungivorum]